MIAPRWTMRVAAMLTPALANARLTEAAEEHAIDIDGRIGGAAVAAAPAVARPAPGIESIQIPVFRDKYAKGWPENEIGDPAKYTSLRTALLARYRTDAHFAAYSVPGIERRLAVEVEVFTRLADGVAMLLFVADVDGPDHKCTDAWWSEQRTKIDRLLADHPGGFMYRTKGGYRLIYVLATPQVLRSVADADLWELRYEAWLDYLATGYEIVGDPACHDWTRLFRLPHTTRDGKMQELETIGDSTAIGVWDVAVVVELPPPPPPRQRTYTPCGDEFDIRAAVAAEWPGARHKISGDKTKVHIGGANCINAAAHTSPNGLTDTTILIFDSGAYIIRCMHGHCSHLTRDDVRRYFQPDWVPFDPSRPPQRSPSEPIPSAEHPHAPHVNGHGTRHVSEIVHDVTLAYERQRERERAGEPSPDEPPNIGAPPAEDVPPPTDESDAAGDENPNAPWRGGKGPAAMAFDFVRKHARHPDGPTIRKWRGGHYGWTADLGCYAARTDDQIASLLHRKLRLSKPSDVRDVRAALIAVDDVLIDDVDLGNWIGKAPIACDPLDICATKNGLLHLPTRKLYDATPRYFATSVLGTVYDSNAKPPEEWHKFLRQLWPTDDESIALLQEWIGYLLTLDTRLQKILGLIGPLRSGKGTIARIITALIGRESVAGPTLASLGYPFGLQPLIGKSAAIISDARLGGRVDMAQIVERLLQLSGEDAISIDRKFLAAWTGYLSARFMLVSNELPAFNEASGALANRFVMLELHESFLGKEDTGLTDRLLSELPGILLWAIDGWDSLRARGKFLQPSSSAALIDDIAELASPVKTWLRQRCDLVSGAQYRMKDAYADYTGWAAEQGHKVP